MTICAETGLVPPAKDVIVRAVVLSIGFLTVNTEFAAVVVMKNILKYQKYLLLYKQRYIL